MRKRNFGKKFYRILALTLFVILSLFISLFSTIDRTPYKKSGYYTQTTYKIKSLAIPSVKGNYFKIGWAKVNITPDQPISIAGYGLRNKYKGVKDSIWVRTFVFDNGKTKAAIVTLDLLIFPPSVSEMLMSRLPKGFNSSNTYLSATHTHNSAGGWAEGIGGRLLAGGYNKDYVEKIVNCILTSIAKATENQEEAQIGFGKFNAAYLIRNRLVNGEKTDPWLRVVKIRKHSGKVALIVSFAAHPTCISSKEDYLSRDYPGLLTDLLEKSEKVNFASFIAGAVGSQAPREYGNKNFEFANFIASHLKYKLMAGFDSIAFKSPKEIAHISIPLNLREPHLKLSEKIRFRPWVFNLLMGKHSSNITCLQIGDIILIGTPCDFSGALTESLNEIAAQKGYNLIITSFNGGYIGYITEDKYYDLGKSETREMNWYGPYNGGYFVEIIRQIIQKL